MLQNITFQDGVLVEGDCMIAIDSILDNSIDLIVTSPPYFMGKDYDTSLSVDDFIVSINSIQSKLYSKLKTGGSLCWQIGSHVKSNTVIPLDYLVYQACSRFSDLKLRNRIVWTFEHGAHAKKRLSGRYETVLWFTKGNEYFFNLDSIRVPQKYPGKRHYKGPNKGDFSGNPLGKNPGDVWSIPNVKANHVEKTGHPCQFPVALVSRLIQALTPDGASVLDPFSGSGTTAIAALENGRKFCCIEMDKGYISLSRERIEQWYAGGLRVRKDVPVYKPNSRSRVATRPNHFALGGSDEV